MVFRKIGTAEPVVAYVVRILEEKLTAGQRVLWLVSGGSAIGVAVAVGHQLDPALTKKLTITLIDERFGPIGHADSNWQQLVAAGFDVPQARLIPVLQGKDIQATTTAFATALQEYTTAADYTLGLFGIGSDGHTAGILPASPPVTATAWAAYYAAPPFERITMTPSVIAALDEAVVFAMGKDKQSALEDLRQDIPIVYQPAQALKHIPKVTIFNDQIGE